MPPGEGDVAYLWDMLNAAREALSYLEGVQETSYLKDRMRQRALERTIEVLGEAASRVSEESRNELSGIDWRRIVGQRVVLAHRYSKVDHALLFKTTRESAPMLIGQLASYLQKAGRT